MTTLKLDASDDNLLIACLDESKTTTHGMGTFLEKLKQGEVEITSAATALLQECQYRGGLMGAEVFDGPKVFAWFGHSMQASVPIDDVSCNAAGRNWLHSLTGKKTTKKKKAKKKAKKKTKAKAKKKTKKKTKKKK